MGSDVKLVKLKDITSKITKGTTPSKSDGGFSSIGVNYIKAESVSYEGRIDESKFAFITEAVHKKLKRSQLQENDILFSMAGAFLGKTGFVMKHHIPANTNQALALIRVKPEIAYPKFIHYYLQQKSVVHFVNNAVSQSAQPNINLQQIGDLDICLLSLAQQQRVVEILDAIDNKITLNRQINQTLEQMAQTLFKSWFVDFDPVIDNALDAGFFEQDLGFSDELLHRVEIRKAVRESGNFKPLSEDIRRLFPDSFEECAESALGLGGWVPKRWQISTVDDELTVKGGSTPSTANPEFWERGNIHWTSPKDLSGSQEKIMLDTERKITELGLRKITSGLLPINTVLMSSRAPIGYLAMAKIPVAINQGYIAITTTKRLSQEYVLYWLDSSMDEIKGIAGGTTFAEISKKTFKSISMIIPDSQVIEKYTVIIKSYLNKATLNAKERGGLEKLRDTLLPKLISGELSLSDIKIDIPEETLI